MKKYRVTVVEECSYHVDVEADSEEAAAEAAIEVMVQTDNRDKMFSACMERDATAVYENPPNWKRDV
jgi:hypothetical protein